MGCKRAFKVYTWRAGPQVVRSKDLSPIFQAICLGHVREQQAIYLGRVREQPHF